jgi:hypothetical protein
MTGHSAATACFPPVVSLPVPLDRDIFLTSLMGELAGTLEEFVGADDAWGFISKASERVGEQINADYRAALAVPELPRARVSEVLVDVCRRIAGGFEVDDEDEERIVLVNRACSCGAARPGMCTMTARVLGVIVAENLGYARVVLDRTTVDRVPACRVTIYLDSSSETAVQGGREYFKRSSASSGR